MTEIIFSHRSVAGVSVGAVSDGAQLFVAFSLVNNGDSRNGTYWYENHDTFSRATARAILRGRLATAKKQGADNRLALKFNTELSARQFMATFRESFKPTVDESDDFLMEVSTLKLTDEMEGIDVRYRPSATTIAERLRGLAQEVVAHASTSV